MNEDTEKNPFLAHPINPFDAKIAWKKIERKSAKAKKTFILNFHTLEILLFDIFVSAFLSRYFDNS